MAQIQQVRFSASKPIEHKAAERPTSDAKLHELLGLPLPTIHEDILFGSLDICTAASLDSFKSDSTDLTAESVNQTNNDGWSPLMYATYLGHLDTARRLLDMYAAPNHKNTVGQTALMLAASCGYNKNKEMLQLLFEYSPEIKAVDSEGRTALHYAALYAQESLLEPLLNAGLDPNAADSTGMTPTLYACGSGKIAAVKEMLRRNGNPKLQNNRGQNGDALAVASEAADVVDLLTLYQLLDQEGLIKYFPIFIENNTTLRRFYNLGISDLERMGITLLGPQKKIQSLIQEYNQKKKVQPTEAPLPTVPQQQRPTQPNDPKLRELSMRYETVMTELTQTHAFNVSLISKLSKISEEVRKVSGGKDYGIPLLQNAIEDRNSKIVSTLKSRCER